MKKQARHDIENTDYSHIIENVYYRVVKKDHIEWALIELREGQENVIASDVHNIILAKLRAILLND
jgi:hypothetical protein